MAKCWTGYSNIISATPQLFKLNLWKVVIVLEVTDFTLSSETTHYVEHMSLLPACIIYIQKGIRTWLLEIVHFKKTVQVMLYMYMNHLHFLQA